MTCTTYILVEFETHVIVSQKLTNQKWVPCLTWSVGSSWIYYYAKNSWKTHVDTHLRVKKFFNPMISHVLHVHKGKLIIRQSPEKLEMSQSHF